MTTEKWDNIIGDIKDKFDVEDQDSDHIDEYGGMDMEYIIFTSPIGKIKLEFISKPIVLDKKTVYSKRIGSETKVDYVYSPDEKSHKMFAYKWDDNVDDWEEINSNAFSE